MEATVENKTKIPAQLQSEFNTLLETTFASEPDWLKGQRKEAFEKFSASGIPSRKNEEYKYTDVRKVFESDYTAIHNTLHKDILLPPPIAEGSVQLIFINGWLHKDSTLSTKFPKGVVIGNMATDGLLKHSALLQKHLTKATDALTFLNKALWTDGAFIFIPNKTTLEKPIEIVHISTGGEELLTSLRHLIILESQAEASIIERSIAVNTKKQQVVNSFSEIIQEDNSKLQYYRVQDTCKNVSQVSSITATLNKNSHFDTNTLSVNNDFVRNNLHIALEGENIETHLNGLFLINGNNFIDNHTAVKHNKPNCQSNQLYKGILNEKATGIFNGKIYVARDAQKTNAFQSSKNILLSDDATINTKPELEIYADDVKCSHGSTTGQLDEESLFYLRARGLGEDNAKRLLLVAFANDVLNTIQIESVRNYFENMIRENLENAS